jgi:hypothetical protein
MKNNRFFMTGMFAVLLTFGLVLSGCSDSSSTGEYKLSWGIWNTANYDYVNTQFSSRGYSLIPAGTNAGYITGTSAANAYNAVKTVQSFDDQGTQDGSFEELLGFTKNSIGLPTDLKATMAGQKTNVPVAGVFQFTAGGAQNVALFYVSKN